MCTDSFIFLFIHSFNQVCIHIYLNLLLSSILDKAEEKAENFNIMKGQTSIYRKGRNKSQLSPFPVLSSNY